MSLTAGDFLRQVAAQLAEAGVDNARMDARLLIAEVLGVSPQTVTMRPETPLAAGQSERLRALVARRAAREPISHILGRRGFWTLDLRVTADTLAPRPDSETVIEAVLAELPERSRPLRVLDFGTGTGCLLLALLSEYPAAHGIGIDRSMAALRVAQSNARAANLVDRVSFMQCDWGSAVGGCHDAIVANPPYIRDQDIATLDPEVALYEPHLALAGGEDGLDCYRALVPQIARLLAPGGVAALEVGAGQAQAVWELLGEAGLTRRAVRRDLGGIERCVTGAFP